MALRTKAIHGAKWSVLQEIIGQLLDFTIILVLARLLDPKDFGVIAIATVIISSVKALISLGLGSAIIQRSEIEDKHLNSAFWSIFIMGLFVALFLVMTAKYGLWSIVFSEPELDSIIQWLSINVVFVSLTIVPEAVLRRRLNFKIYAIRSSIGKLIGGCTGIALAFYGFGVWSLVARYLVGSLVSVFLLWGISNWYPRFMFSIKHFKELMHFGLRVITNEYLVFINRNADSILISYFLGTTALGYYNIAYKLMSVIFILVSKSVSQVGMPAFSRLQNNKENMWKAFYDVTQLISLIIFPAFLGIWVLVPEIITSLLGNKWIPSIPVLQILLLIGILHCLLSPIVAMLVGSGRPGLRLKIQAVDSVANLIGFSLAVHWGIVWVAVSYVVVGYAISPLWLWATTKVVNVHWSAYFRIILRPLLITVVMMSSILTTKLTLLDKIGNINFIVLSITGGCLLYASLIYWFYPTIINKITNVIKTLISKKEKKVLP